ncbi:MAG TPA: cadherin-like domain-containing protein [Meiothermus sp.]|nr:cadherin-like domain-containing protein [Meiothermus sp.]
MLLVLWGLIAACNQPSKPAQNPPPPPVVQQPKFNPKLLGAAEISFDSGARTAKVSFVRQGVSAAFVDENTLKFTSSSFTTLDTAGGFRFLNATFKVENLGSSALNNLTLVAYYRKKPGGENVNGSAFFNIQDFGGGSTHAEQWALQLHPSHGMQSVGGNAVVNNALADLQIFKPAETATLQTSAQSAGLINAGGVTGEAVLQYGYVARNNAGGRNLPASSNNNQLTVALRVPQNGDPNTTAYRYSMTFLVFEDNVTRVTESLEEQSASQATTRAAAVGATQIAVMCGSTYAGTNPALVFVPSVKTAGAGSSYLAWMGGNFTITTETPPSITVSGNVPKTFSDSALLGGYQALGGAILDATGFASTDANLISENGGNFTFTTEAGKRPTTSFTYKVSDGSCTSPAQPANVTVQGMYWFVNNSGANGSGRFGSPFNTLAGAQNTSQAGDVIFVYRGNGTNSGQNSGITLKNAQKLIGEGAGLTVDDVSIAAGTNPVMGNAGGAGITLAQNNEVKGLDISGTSSGIISSGFGTLTMSAASVSASAGPALNLSNGALAVTLKSLNSSGGTNNLLLNTTTGTLNVTGDGSTAGSGGTLQGAGGEGLKLTNPGGVALRYVNIKNSGTHGVSFVANGGSNGLTLQNAVVEAAGQVAGIAGYGVWAEVSGTGTTTLSFTGSTIKQNEQSGIYVHSLPGSNAVVNLIATGNTFQDNQANGLDLVLESSGASTYDVSNNTLTNTLRVFGGFSLRTEVVGASPLIQGRVNNNSVDLNPGTLTTTANSIGISVETIGSESSRLQMSGNTVRDYDSYGIRVLTSSTTSGRLDLTLTGNTTTTANSNSLAIFGIEVTSGISSTAGPNTVCLNMTANTDASLGYRLRQRIGNTFALQGFGGNGTSTAAVASFVQTNNPGTTVTVSPAGGTLTVNYINGTCATPSF